MCRGGSGCWDGGYGEMRAYQSADDKREAEPCSVLHETVSVREEEDKHDQCGDGSGGDGGSVRPEHIFWHC